MYTLVGHGNIIRTERVDVPANQKSFIIRFLPSIEMIPVVYLYVYYILDGSFKFEEIALRFPLEFENRVNYKQYTQVSMIYWNKFLFQISVEAPKEVQPGEEVTITLKAQSKSYVSILAVDLSVYLLDNSYDLKKSEILDDLLNDRTFTKTNGAGALTGVITFTNANSPMLFVQRKWKRCSDSEVPLRSTNLIILLYLQLRLRFNQPSRCLYNSVIDFQKHGFFRIWKCNETKTKHWFSKSLSNLLTEILFFVSFFAFQ